MLSDLIHFLGERSYIFSDSEASYLFPYILEKNSMAKGRFRDLFDALSGKAKSLNVLPPKVMGAAVCAMVFEKSANAKARVLAYNECAESVEAIGLSGVGKRGLLVVARMVSEEKLPENRSAALDLILVILGKMDGDTDRLVRLCSTHMSDKSRELIEERWQKRNFPRSASISTSILQHTHVEDDRPSKVSRIPSSRSSIGERRRALQGLSERSAATQTMTNPPSQQELPLFQLRLDAKVTAPPPQSKAEIPQSLGPFTFSYSSVTPAGGSPFVAKNGAISTSSPIADGNTTAIVGDDTTDLPAGAAASLRARLMKIRQKNLSKEELAPPFSNVSDPFENTSAVASITSAIPVGTVDNYDSAMTKFGKLACSSVVSEDNHTVQSCIMLLKRFHTAITENETTSERSLRDEIKQDVTNCVDRLTSVLKIAFKRGESSENAGMCVPLLSVVLATLMALFRDVHLAPFVSQDALIVLIRATGDCLLDSRLAVSATHVSGLDESTSSQMVRGMNKVS